MVVSEAAINLRKTLGNTHICGSTHDPSTKFKAELDELADLKCSVFCKEKTESDCPIRNCCLTKNFEGCWECGDAPGCTKLSQQFKENCEKINENGLTSFISEY